MDNIEQQTQDLFNPIDIQLDLGNSLLWEEGKSLAENPDYVKSALPKLHQGMYQHMLNCNMPETAALFMQESKFFPYLRVSKYDDVPVDTLSKAWYEHWAINKEAPTEEPNLLSVENVKMEPVKIEEEIDLGESEDKKQFPCEYPDCTGCFTTLANLKRHEKLHSGEKPFVCPFETCKKTFARKYDLKVHTRTHTKEKPFGCKHCGKRFSRTSSLREHERNIHKVGAKMIRCKYVCEANNCRKKFSQQAELDLHREMSHGTTNPAAESELWSELMNTLVPPQ
jgi:hypothetical protein